MPSQNINNSKTPAWALAKIQEVKNQQLKRLDLEFEPSGDLGYAWREADPERLKEIPPEVFELTDLESLNLSNNQISEIPEAIAQLQNLLLLDLSNNRISIVPEAITQLDKSITLKLTQNPIVMPPIEVVARGIKSIAAYYRHLNICPNCAYDTPRNALFCEACGTELRHFSTQISTNTQLKTSHTLCPDCGYDENPTNALFCAACGFELNQSMESDLSPCPIPEPLQATAINFQLYEAKLIIIGEAGAGKTSLAKKIQDPDCKLSPSEGSTEGIDIIQFNFSLENGHTFRVNIWDFGGQEIYHATHQFFLTKRSLYALVDDSRAEQTDFYYWLNTVELLSDASPLLIIQNQKQDRKGNLNQTQLRGQFPHLKDTLETNLATNRGLPQLIDTLKHYLKQLPHIGSTLPKTWVNVRNEIDSDPRNTISLDQYLELCEQSGFTRREDALQLSGYLHDLGVCLHFQDDESSKLYDTLILKPTWGTAAVYKVLDSEIVCNQYGRFDWTDLKHIWADEQYASKRGELLELMKKFELCYEIPTQTRHYIAPQLLNNEPPAYEWDDTQNLILRYTYDFMPKGILSRLIVALHQRIHEQRYVWKSGVILTQDQTQAEVIEYYGKREIKIRIAGKNKRDLMTIVTHELDKIHDSYHRLKYQKLIPCNCAECNGSQTPHFYKFSDLKRRVEKGRSAVECEDSYDRVNVRSLIDDVMQIATLFDTPQQKRLRSEIDSLQRMYDTMSEKLDRLRRDLAAQAGSAIAFQLEKEIEQTEAERATVEQKLQQLENQLR